MPPTASEPSPPDAAEPLHAPWHSTTGHDVEDSAQAWAVGTLMALTPCTAPAAGEILDVAASTAGVTVRQVADALVQYSRGVSLPRRIERAVQLAIQIARAPATERPCGLLPGTGRAAAALDQFRRSRILLQAVPADPDARRSLDDAAYTLCVLMGRRTAHEAMLAAEEYVATSPVA